MKLEEGGGAGLINSEGRSVDVRTSTISAACRFLGTNLRHSPCWCAA
jgi:hypothetical protein